MIVQDNWTSYALPYLKETRGRFVGVSSIAGKCPTARASGYPSSKAAVTGFYNSLRQELAGSGVSVTGIYPKVEERRLKLFISKNNKNSTPADH
jgi:short-subunit dehydrogenase